jgi:hypothetical protein
VFVEKRSKTSSFPLPLKIEKHAAFSDDLQMAGRVNISVVFLRQNNTLV